MKSKVLMDDNVVLILMCIYSEEQKTVASFGETRLRFVNTWWTDSNINKMVDKS